MGNIIEIQNLYKKFPLKNSDHLLRNKKKYMTAIDNLSFCIEEGTTYGIVGESGCGKTTTGRCILGLEKPDNGQILFNGHNIANLKESEFRPYRKDIQLIYQDTLSSLNPRLRIYESVAEPLRAFQNLSVEEIHDKTINMLNKVGLGESHYFRYPHELSGGQVQRLGIARALINSPKFVVCDECVSALDVSIQSQILNLLRELQKEMNLTLLFISHDVSVVRYISHRIGVMYCGKLVEEAESEELISSPLHPYTQALISSVPQVEFDKIENFSSISGEQKMRTSDMNGCPFFERCSIKTDQCKRDNPILEPNSKNPDRFVACFEAHN